MDIDGIDYSDSGELLAQYVDHQVVSFNDEYVLAISIDETDVLVASRDLGLKVAIVGSGEGTMNVSVALFTEELNNAGVNYFLDVPVAVGSSYTLNAEAYASAFQITLQDEDGVPDVYDALRILQYLAGWDVKLNAINADVNGDGVVNISDALEILEYCMGGDMTKALRALEAMIKSMSINALEIVEQPADQYADIGVKAQFAVSAAGDGLTYQWYINRNDGKGWSKLSGVTSATYSTSAIERYHDGYQYRCVITDVYGNELTSDTAVLYVALELPNTGDIAAPMLWLAMWILSACGIAFMRRKRVTR